MKKREQKSAGRPASTLQDCPSKNVETRILKEGLESVAAIARKQGIEKEALLAKLVQESCRSYDWDMAEFLSSLRVSSPVPINELTALFHVANLLQRQYQMYRNLLVRYGVEAFKPRHEIDSYKKSLYPSVSVESLTASMKVKESFDSTLHSIVFSENLSEKLADMPEQATLLFNVKAGLDGSASYKRQHQLSGNVEDDALAGCSEHFLGVFMTPVSIAVSYDDLTHAATENNFKETIQWRSRGRIRNNSIVQLYT